MHLMVLMLTFFLREKIDSYVGCFVYCFVHFRSLKECKDFHQAKDGDGWVEQSSQPFLFGLLQKV